MLKDVEQQLARVQKGIIELKSKVGSLVEREKELIALLQGTTEKEVLDGIVAVEIEEKALLGEVALINSELDNIRSKQ